MYRQRTNLLSELSTTEGAPPDSYRDQRESHVSQMEGKRRQSISRERTSKVSTQHRLLSTEKARDTPRDRGESPISSRTGYGYQSGKEASKGAWPAFAKENNGYSEYHSYNKKEAAPTPQESGWRAVESSIHREYKEALNELENLKYEYGALQERYGFTMKRIEDLDDENREMSIKFENIKADYQVLEDQYNICRNEMDKSDDQLRRQEVQHDQKMASLEREVQALLEEKKILQDQNAHFKERASKAASDKKGEKQKREDEKKELSKKLRDTQERMERLRDEVDTLKKEKKELYDDNRKLAHEADHIERKLEAVIEEEKKLRHIVEELKGRNSNLSREEKKAKEKVVDLEQEIQAMEKNHRDTLESVKKRYEEGLIRKQQDVEALQDEYERIRQERDAIDEDRVRIERKLDTVSSNFDKREREVQEEKTNLFGKINNATDENGKLDKENRKLKQELKLLEAQLQETKEGVKKQQEKNSELKKELEETKRDKEKIKESVQKYLDQGKEIQKKEEELLKYKITEQDHLAKIKTLEGLIEEYKREKLEDKLQGRKSWAMSPMRAQNRRTEGAAIIGVSGLKDFEPQERRTWKAGEQSNYRDRSIERTRETEKNEEIGRGVNSTTPLEVDVNPTERLASFGNRFNERSEQFGISSVKERGSVRGGDELDPRTLKSFLEQNSSGNQDLMRLRQKYNQIKTKDREKHMVLKEY